MEHAGESGWSVGVAQMEAYCSRAAASNKQFCCKCREKPTLSGIIGKVTSFIATNFQVSTKYMTDRE